MAVSLQPDKLCGWQDHDFVEVGGLGESQLL